MLRSSEDPTPHQVLTHTEGCNGNDDDDGRSVMRGNGENRCTGKYEQRFRRSPGIGQQLATNQFFEIAAGQLLVQTLSIGPKVCTSSDRGGIELYLRVCW